MASEGSAGALRAGRRRAGARRPALRSPRARRARWLLLAVLGLLALVAVASAILGSTLGEEPIRRLLERRMNARLHGYRVEIGRVDLHPLAMGFQLHGLVIAQSDAPEPPVAQIAELDTSVEWRALLRGALVADVRVKQPVVHVDRRQVSREARDETPLHERGWQDALQAAIPLEINHFEIVGGEATYLAARPFRVLRLSEIQAEAANLRNVASRDREYPSTFALDARVFEEGRLHVSGHADFLAKPRPGVEAEVELERVDLETFQPILAERHFDVRDGRLALAGDFEFGRTVQRVRLRELRVSDLAGDYVRSEAMAAREKEVAREAVDVAREATTDPVLQLRADRIELENAHVGMRNVGEPGTYRVFLSGLHFELDNFSNRFSEGTGHVRLTGLFMGSGTMEASATFRAERAGPDFDLAMQVVDTELRGMNDLLRAYGKLDVAEGLFSLYSELHVQNGHVRGYVKPLFRELDVHDPQQDRGDSLVSRAYESLAGGVGRLLENRRRDEVATEVDLSGPLEDPRMGTWQAIAKLVENAFVRAILPGFERELGPREPD